MALISRLSPKGQTTLPKQVREALGLRPGDHLLYEMGEDGTVRLRKAEVLDLEYLKALEATLNEWASPEDEEAYRGL